MLGTYATAFAVCLASLLIGQAALAICGRRAFSWIAPPVGLAVLLALCWATVELPGEGTAAAVAVLAVSLASLVYLRGRVEGAGEALRRGAPVAALALLAGSLPFIAEGHFGILGTSFNPDMSQHLLAASRMSDGLASQLAVQGYPLGPHAIAVAADAGMGTGLVNAFSGLTLAVPVLASLTALALFEESPAIRRIPAALLVGIPYLVASYLVQGAFKETIEALLVLGFALGLREISRGRAGSDDAAFLAGIPLALIAAGSVFAYSFPSLAWIGLTLVIWGAAELLFRRGSNAGGSVRRVAAPLGVALLVFALLVAPEISRMSDFRDFETFDPTGPGLGNLFGQLSPAEALGVWPTGDFRLSAGDGAVPAFAFYLACALGVVLLAFGLVWSVRRRDFAVPAALVACAAVYIFARADGTPYQASKALQMAAPVAMALILVPWVAGNPLRSRLAPLVPAAFALAAGVCSVLALANGPVGPADYTTKLTKLRAQVGTGATLVLADPELLEERHGTEYIAWELRGGRVCIASTSTAGGPPPAGVRWVIAPASLGPDPPFRGLADAGPAGPWHLWQRLGRLRSPSDCPLIAVRQARAGEPRE